MERTFGDFLANKRKEKKLTQKNLAEILYVSESAVSKWEKDVAHPDITLLPKIAEILGVTEHELITACIDKENRKKDVQAKKWKNLIFSFNMFFYIAYGIAILTCFIVNLAVSKTLSWFWIVLASIILAASFTTLPQYIKKYKLIFVPLCELLALLLMLLICNIYTHGHWFWISSTPIIFTAIIVFLPIIISKYDLPKFLKKHNALICVAIDCVLISALLLIINVIVKGNWFVSIALPFALICSALALLMVLISRYLKVNNFIKTGLNLILWDAVYMFLSYATPVILSNAGVDITGSYPFAPFKFDFSIWTAEYITYNVTFLVFLTLAVLAIVFLIIGLSRKKKKA